MEYRTDRFAARAVEVTGPERDALYSRQTEILPQFGGYAEATSRVIPAIALERR